VIWSRTVWSRRRTLLIGKSSANIRFLLLVLVRLFCLSLLFGPVSACLPLLFFIVSSNISGFVLIIWPRMVCFTCPCLFISVKPSLESPLYLLVSLFLSSETTPPEW
jgi:hypothetical protein